MKNRSLQFLSLSLILISLILELSENQGWISFNAPETLFGISLALVLVSMSINVKIIRTMGIEPKARKVSQLALVITVAYALAVFGLEVI